MKSNTKRREPTHDFCDFSKLMVEAPRGSGRWHNVPPRGCSAINLKLTNKTIVMGRKPNVLPNKTVSVTVTLPLYNDLVEVVLTGYYGTNVSSAIERLAGEAMRNLRKEGTIIKKKVS